MAPQIALMAALVTLTPGAAAESDCATAENRLSESVDWPPRSEVSFTDDLKRESRGLHSSWSESACLIPYDQLTGNEVLIDQRAPRQREIWPVANSLQGLSVDPAIINAFSPRQVILFGSGRDDQRLVKLCEERRKEGADNIQVLRGGALAIAAAIPSDRGPVSDSIYLISSSELLRFAVEGAIILNAHEVDSELLSWQGELGLPLTEPGAGEARANGADGSESQMKIVLLPEGASPSQWRSKHDMSPDATTVFYNRTLERFRSDIDRAEAIASNAYKPLPSGACGR